MNDLHNRVRIADQMITAYSVLRDRYARRSTLLTLVIFLAAVVLCTCTFLSDEALAKIDLAGSRVSLIIGIASSIVLFTSIVELCVDWKEKAREYGVAADKLAEYKIKFRYKDSRALADRLGKDEENAASAAYREVMGNLPRIPDGKFVRLKAYHLKKVHLSKMIDDNVGVPMIVLRLRLFWSALSKSQKSHDAGKDK